MAEELKSTLTFLQKYAKGVKKDMQSILRATGKGKSRMFKIINLGIIVTKTDKGYSLVVGLPAYAKFLDGGRKPGKQPPLKTIIEWCKRKGMPNKYLFPIAKNIAKKIGEKGLPATNFLEPIRRMRKDIPGLKEIIGKDIKEQISAQFKTPLE